ncbi:amidohydrolase family protein [Dehalococcoidia bacterium]|nr:amidohydrolase family protein [Dehalococcoidia bacterium]
MRIDVHTHLVHFEFLKYLHGRSSMPNAILEGGSYVINCTPWYQQTPPRQVCDVEVKLRDMEDMETDISVLSHGIPGPELLGGADADYWASRINDHIASVVDDYPGKFIGMGSIGFGDPDRSIAEIDRCIHELGFKGIQIFSNTQQKVSDLPEFLPVYRHISSLGVPINMHPTAPINYTGIDSLPLVNGIGFIYDTSLSAVRLIMSGLFDQEPNLLLIVPHLGGIIPYLRGRIEREIDACPLPSNQPKLAHPFKYYLDKIYVDTVAHSIEALDYCYRICGPKRLLFGTDHPFGPFSRLSTLVEQLDCSEADRELIYHGNAERLLGI